MGFIKIDLWHSLYEGFELYAVYSVCYTVSREWFISEVTTSDVIRVICSIVSEIRYHECRFYQRRTAGEQVSETMCVRGLKTFRSAVSGSPFGCKEGRWWANSLCKFPRFPIDVITIHQRYRQTDGRTDGACDRKTALCTKVHCAVKINRYY